MEMNFEQAWSTAIVNKYTTNANPESEKAYNLQHNEALCEFQHFLWSERASAIYKHIIYFE